MNNIFKWLAPKSRFDWGVIAGIAIANAIYGLADGTIGSIWFAVLMIVLFVHAAYQGARPNEP